MYWDKKYEDFRAGVRDFAERVVGPLAVEIDQTQRFPRELLKPLAEEGYLGMVVSKKYGGSGFETLQYAIAVEEFSRICGSTGITIAAHNSLGLWPIFAFGTEEQKRKYLPRACSGELLAFGLTEPGAGSDAGGTKTRAVYDGEKWTINGAKCWITSATECFAATITAKTSDEPGSYGISSFIVEKDMPGFSAGKKEDKLGLRGSDTAFLHLSDVDVPPENQLGETGEGFKQFMMTLDGGRISIGAMAIGLGQAALDDAANHAVKLDQAGFKLSENQGIAFKLADMVTELEAARGLVYKTAMMKDEGLPFSMTSAQAKLFASEVGTRCAANAIGILGAEGLRVGDHPSERAWRDVKLCEIGEGTSEIQRIVISRQLLKDYSEQLEPAKENVAEPVAG
ncbi:MAG: acyl-CoA dehydrogenase family protein [Candidatus Zixiibacteriota bacterium]